MIPIGGHTQPISGVGDSLLWKKAQKNLTKNIISETINKTIPNRIPDVILEESQFKFPNSRTTSRHHWYIVNKMESRPNNIHRPPKSENQAANPEVINSALNEEVAGHGLVWII